MLATMSYNINLMDPLDSWKKKFSIIEKITNIIVTSDNINTISNGILDLALNYANAEKGSLMMIDERGELHILASRGLDIAKGKADRVRLGEGIAGVVAESRVPILVKDIEKDERFGKQNRDRYRTKSFVSCPIVSTNRLLGVFNINDKKNNEPFTEDEFDLLRIIASQAAVAIENALLMNQLRAKAKDLEEINRKLIDSDIAKSEFLMRVSHGLRTPLNSIKGAAYYLQQSETPDASSNKEFYDIISAESENLTGIVENLLDFLRTQDESRMVRKTIIDLPDLLRELTSSFSVRSFLAKRNVHLEVEIKKHTSGIVGDKISVSQFFLNVIEALSQYLKKGDRMLIVVDEDDFVRINLNLPRRLPANVTADFSSPRNIFQEDQSPARLKLYLAWRISAVHRWRLELHNIKDTSVLTITIPTDKKQKTDVAVNVTLEAFLEFASEFLDVNICSVMLANELTNDLAITSAIGLDDEVVKTTKIRIGDRIAGWVALEGKPLLIEDIENDPRFGKKNISQYNTRSLLSLPLKIQDKTIGVMNLNNKRTSEPFTMRDFFAATVLSDRISHVIEKIRSREYSEDDFRNFIVSMQHLADAQRKYNKKDTYLTDLVMRAIDAFQVGEEDKKIAVYVSMIYDLGLASLDDHILSKRRLLPEEIHTLKIHPQTTLDLIKAFEFSEEVKEAILHHHERYDGTGYPDRLRGAEIPVISRVLSVVDAFYSMIQKRPYRKTFTVEEALREIKSDSGSAYDPEVVRIFESVLSESPFFPEQLRI
jgi:GAF domain-containing protein